jgi:hypothetical protein
LANAIKVASLALGNFAFDKATRDQACDDIEQVMYCAVKKPRTRNDILATYYHRTSAA